MIDNRQLYPLVFVDIALFSTDERGLRVLHIQRAEEPAKGRWALPGGMLRPHEDNSLEDAARRVLRRKLGVDVRHLEQVRIFSGPDRDTRGWSISVLFYALLPRDQINAVVRQKINALDWVDPAKPGHRLAFDHAEHLTTALQVLREKVDRHALPLHLLSERFTLTELQRTCEAILGRRLDKSVFRRRIKGSEDLIALEEFVHGAQRPAQLHRAREGFVF